MEREPVEPTLEASPSPENAPQEQNSNNSTPKSTRRRRASSSGRDRSDFRTVEIYESFDEPPTDEGNKEKPTWKTRIGNFFLSENWFFLLLLGMTCAGVGFVIDICIQYLYKGQLLLVGLLPNEGGRWVIWVLWSLFFSSLAILVIEFISPNAAGSGIPECKAILSGIEINRFLNFKTFVAKVLGLIFAFAGGLSVGKEGPMVHICAIICSLLSKIPFFSSIRKNDAALMQVLAAACGVGTTIAFGTPVGGVLFSIEVTSSFYLVDSLWRGFFVAVCAESVFVISHRLALIQLFETDWTIGTWNLQELLIFGAIGLCGGLLGGAFVRFLSLVFRLARASHRLQTWWGHLLRGLFVALLIGIVAYPFPFMRNDITSIISHLAQKDVISDWVGLVALLFAKFFFTLFSVGFTGCTAGVYSPVFITGAVFGRLAGELASVLFPDLDISPGAYAIVGAGAFAAGVTRTISTAVLVVELTKQINLLLPILVAVLVSMGVGRLLSASVYSVLIEHKDLPAMPRLKLYNPSSTKVASEIMESDIVSLSSHATFGEVAQLLHDHKFPTFPLVDETGIFLGIVRRRNLVKVVSAHKIDYANLPSGSPFGNYHNNEKVVSGSGELHETGADDDESSIPLDEPAAPGEVQSKRRERSGKTDLTSVTQSIKNALGGGGSGDSTFDQYSKEDIMNQPIPLVFPGARRALDSAATTDMEVVPVDSSAMQVSEQTSMAKVHFLFTVLGLSHIYITARGRLVGVITRKLLIHAISGRVPKSFV